MKYKGTLIVVKDCKRALKFYSDMFGFQLLKDNVGNMDVAPRKRTDPSNPDLNQKGEFVVFYPKKKKVK